MKLLFSISIHEWLHGSKDSEAKFSVLHDVKHLKETKLDWTKHGIKLEALWRTWIDMKASPGALASCIFSQLLLI